MEIPKIIADKKAFVLLKHIQCTRGRFYKDVEAAGLFPSVGEKAIQQYCLYPEKRLNALKQNEHTQIAVERLAEILANHLAEVKQKLAIRKEEERRGLEITTQALIEIDQQLENYGTATQN